MLACRCLLLSCLLSMTLFHCSADGFRLSPQTKEYPDPLVQEESGILSLNPEKSAGGLTQKFRLLDRLAHLENDVIETKRKRSFPGGNTPLDRLSVGTMEAKTKQRHHTEEGGRRVVEIQSLIWSHWTLNYETTSWMGHQPITGKVVELPRRRVSAPIDRIGVGRLPSNRG